MKYMLMNKLHCLAVIYFILLVTNKSNGSFLPWFGKTCEHTMFFDPSTFRCSECPRNATVVNGVCQCDDGFAYVTNAETGISACESCNSRKQVVSSFRSVNGSQICVPCGGDSQLNCLVDSQYDAMLRQCVCPSGLALVESVGSVVLSAQMCIRCMNGNCSSCDHPYVATSSGSCACQSGYTRLYDGSCVPRLVYDSIAIVTQNTSTTLVPPNVDNSGRPGVAITPDSLRENAIGSAILCRKGNLTACNYLVNLCVLMMYESKATPCALYLHLQKNEKCETQWCEPSLSLPQLYYNFSHDNNLAYQRRKYRFATEKELTFVVSTYDLNGTWKGFHRLHEKTNLCQLPTPTLLNFFRYSETRKVSCYLNWGWFFTANDAEFYDVYLMDPANESDWIPIPLLIDYSNYRFDFQSKQDVQLYGSDVTSGGTSLASRFRHRFYAYVDNAHTKRYNNSALSYITTIWSMSLLFFPQNEWGYASQMPLLVLQYASKDISALQGLMHGSFHNLPLNEAYAPCCTLGVVQQTIFLPKEHSANGGVRVALIVLSCLCLLTSLFRTYGWMRRRQNYLLDRSAFLRFIIYLFDHISNTYFIIVCLSSWYFYLLQKLHPRFGNVTGDNEVYITSMLYVILVAKSISVSYRLAEQCNAYYFLIDWERTNGQPFVEDKVVPVSMWRSTLVANKLNELQTLRYWSPLQVMVIILIFLGGVVYRSAPLDDLAGCKTNCSAELSGRTLRTAVDTFLWIAVTLSIYLLRFHIYYRYIVVHPLQAFADLCSVSNISVIILIEDMYGFYIHGESIHDYTDVSMREFQHNLFLESQGSMPMRGLGGQSEYQTFEVYISPCLRQYLYVCYNELFLECQESHKNLFRAVHPASWHFFGFIVGLTKTPHVFSQTVFAIKEKINHALQMSVSRVERVVLDKFFLQKLFNFPPSIIHLNGSENHDREANDLFFFDDVSSYGCTLMCGLDFHLLILYSVFFAIVEFSLENIYVSMVLTFVIEAIIHWYRKHEGMANFSRKMIIDN